MTLVSAGIITDRVVHASVHVKVFFALAGVCLAVTVLSSLAKSIEAQRRIYWGGTAGAALFTFIGLLPDWTGGLGLAAAGLFAMALAAYFTSSYIKIAGKIYAFHTRDGQPDRAASAGRLRPSRRSLRE
ncbi:hypothetical protein [Mycolicibacterium komossense]|uniref:Uncharacterized protein n=1 Tax=Mycolicibacterium komossense TaxID=1779 RepID=A0ABT3CLC1_9MYCO|nr:hypothetical protein [Mycolicibacterium komossense]MCV7230239.1 hypothetical protein [Mycolicibacterium komossense]